MSHTHISQKLKYRKNNDNIAPVLHNVLIFQFDDESIHSDKTNTM